MLLILLLCPDADGHRWDVSDAMGDRTIAPLLISTETVELLTRGLGLAVAVHLQQQARPRGRKRLLAVSRDLWS
jgi:hypothetical protein